MSTMPFDLRQFVSAPRIVGILNLTPDSFSDGGAYRDVDQAADAARRMIDAGADALDLGGESTRPGAHRIDAEQQKRRVLPTLEKVAAAADVPLSIDTTRAAVAEAALDAGATIINDVSAGRDDPGVFALAADRGAPLVLMHMQGEPATMQQAPAYGDVTEDVRRFLLQRVEAAAEAGVPRGNLILDPGIGFGKTHAHNLALLRHLDRLTATGHPVLLGASRKGFLGTITATERAEDRVAATCATTALGVAAGVRLFRVHDVAANRHAADTAFAVHRAE